MVLVVAEPRRALGLDSALPGHSGAGWDPELRGRMGTNSPSSGSTINAMTNSSRLDGHIVQGHVDATATCIQVEEVDGSWYYTFRYQPTPEHLLVDKGSICINGVSLTVVNPVEDTFSVAIIPYTYEHTTFHTLKAGDAVNLEFDILGKYIAKYAHLYMKAGTTVDQSA